MNNRKNNRGSGLLSLLFAAAIIGLMYYFMLGGQKRMDSSKDGYLKQMSVDARSYNSMLESTKKVLDDQRKRSQAE